MKSAIFITARTKSTRLPKKVLLEIKGKTIIEHLIERLKMAKLPDLIVLCTSTNPNDDVLVEIAKKNGIECFRGNEDDVLDRFEKAADFFNLDFIVVTWGDEPFCDPEYIDKMIDFYKETNADYINCEGLPAGTFTYGLKVDALKRACEIKAETDTEIWGGYFTESGMFDVRTLKVEDEIIKNSNIRLTIDYPEDFELVKEIFNRLYKGKVFPLKEIIKLLKENPELQEINKNCQELYEANIKRLTKVKFKKPTKVK